MTARHTIRATGPGDLLGLVPSLLGFHPADSVVLLTVGDARQPFHARVDLPRDAEEVDALASYLTTVAERSGVRRVAIVLYTDDASAARAVVDALDIELLVADIDVVCVVRADGERWWVLDPVGETGGGGYDALSHPLMAEAVVQGTVVLSSRQELADSLVGNDPQEIEEVAKLVDARLARLEAGGDAFGPAAGSHQVGAEEAWVAERVERFVVDGERLTSDELGRLLAGMAFSVRIRDAAWGPMSREDAAQHVDLWRDVVRRTPTERRAAPAALLGFAAWLSGSGALAWCAVECALDAEPGYSMAGLLAEVLTGAMPPSAWQPLRPRHPRLPAG
jgi:hypothetical protein